MAQSLSAAFGRLGVIGSIRDVFVVFDRGHNSLGPLRAIAARGSHMQLDDADVRGREEVGPDHRHERPGQRNQNGEAAQDELPAQVILPGNSSEEFAVGK